MSVKSNIQYCDGTINPVMGCQGGCELWATMLQLATAIYAILCSLGHINFDKAKIQGILKGKSPSDVYHSRKILGMVFAMELAVADSQRPAFCKAIEDAIRACFTCYAGILHLNRALDITQPLKNTNRGYSPKFEVATLYPGRMASAARWSDLRGTLRPDKPWMHLLPRVIFISDMGDALSGSVAFSYLKVEIIDNVTSPNGQNHIWLWITKRPHKMAAFSEWLRENGLDWPDNLVAMTTITSAATLGRVHHLQKVKCKFRGLSVEPLWSPVVLPLEGISWVITGGASGAYAKPFDICWARQIKEQCRKVGVAYFGKQLGSTPCEGETPILLEDRHGGDWTEWPADLRTRQYPREFFDPFDQYSNVQPVLTAK
jgi:protein gp37